MIEYVADTMAVTRRIEGRRIGRHAQRIFDDAEKGLLIVHVPAMVFGEILYLSQKRRITCALADVSTFLTKHPNFVEAQLSLTIVQVAELMDDIPELHDRLIAATARQKNCELVSNDSVIQKSKWVNTIW